MGTPELKDSLEDRFFVYVAQFPIGNKLREIHYYTHLVGDKTQLYIFGCGLGDQAIFEQVADSFFKYIEQFGDPELGRVVISAGICRTAFLPYRGDVNCHWIWGGSESDDQWLPHLLSNISIKPDVFLCASKEVLTEVEEAGYRGLYLPVGVGDVFEPLKLKRKGFGYAGLDSKSDEQKRIVLEPAMKRKGFEWISHEPFCKFLTLHELNEWYNRKQILLGMISLQNLNLNLLSNRVFESIASGTPFIVYRYEAVEETLGFPYPYQTSTQAETANLIDKILNNFERTLKEFKGYSKQVHEKHHYIKRLTTLFKYLQELKR